MAAYYLRLRDWFHVRFLRIRLNLPDISIRIYSGVQYPFLGPPEVRRLLIFRGISG